MVSVLSYSPAQLCLKPAVVTASSLLMTMRRRTSGRMRRLAALPGWCPEPGAGPAQPPRSFTRRGQACEPALDTVLSHRVWDREVGQEGSETGATQAPAGQPELIYQLSDYALSPPPGLGPPTPQNTAQRTPWSMEARTERRVPRQTGPRLGQASSCPPRRTEVPPRRAPQKVAQGAHQG